MLFVAVPGTFCCIGHKRTMCDIIAAMLNFPYLCLFTARNAILTCLYIIKDDLKSKIDGKKYHENEQA